VLLRKSCCEQVGMFDVRLTRLGSEDRDLWLRVAEKYEVLYVPKVLAYYRIREGSASHQLDRMEQARLYIIDKFCRQRKYAHLRRRALAKIYRDIGDTFLFRNDFAKARHKYLQSLFYGPFSFWTWLNSAKSILKIKVKQGAPHVS
jgi:hypothetical protein